MNEHVQGNEKKKEENQYIVRWNFYPGSSQGYYWSIDFVLGQSTYVGDEVAKR